MTGHRMNRVTPDGVRSEAGTTLAEMAVVMTILSLLMLSAAQVLFSTSDGTFGSDERNVNLNEGRLFMATVTKDLRTATRLSAGTSPFLLAADREAKFYANLDTTTGPQLVHLYVDVSTELIEQVTPPDAGSAPNYTYVNGPTTTRYVARYVANSNLQPIFGYYDSNGVQLSTTGGGLSASDLLAVHSVGVSLSVRHTTTLSVNATMLVNRVRLPNLDYNPLNGGGP
jgi:type II secretory pathway pseudopilin PulG